jgi:Mn-dependent DtxR family transcriptional regulator
MKGSHHIVVQNRRVRFEFSARRNITSADVGELLGVSQPRARAIVHDMLEAGLFKRRGEGRTTYYEPAHTQQ